jgi:hypothetical protein
LPWPIEQRSEIAGTAGVARKADDLTQLRRARSRACDDTDAIAGVRVGARLAQRLR